MNGATRIGGLSERAASDSVQNNHLAAPNSRQETLTRSPIVAADESEIRRFADLILAPGQVTELRAPNATANGSRQVTLSGYFDNAAALVKAAIDCSRRAPAVYIIPNVVNSALLARAANRVRECGQKDATTGDDNIMARRWLLIDCDAIRPSGISSSDAEHDAAIARARTIGEALARDGWPASVIADSGNGGHLLYRIDLPADDRGLVEHCLKALAARFSDSTVKVDTSVANAARIWKLYGTPSKKGDHTVERPHRLSRLLEVPDRLNVVPPVLLEQLAVQCPSSAPMPFTPVTIGSGGASTSRQSSFDLGKWVATYLPGAKGPRDWQGGERWVLPVCPWNAEHRDTAFVVRLATGAIGAGCLHDSCGEKDWHSLRDAAEPGWRDRRAIPAAAKGSQVDATTPIRRPLLVRMSDVEPERVRWLWPGRIPLGKLTMLDGDPGLGKSFLTLDIAARVSTSSPMPDGTIGDVTSPGGVILMSAEDDPADTIRPRLDAAGADCDRIQMLRGVEAATESHGRSTTKTRAVTIADVDAIEAAIKAVDAKLVVIDPVMAFTVGDTHIDAEVRQTLAKIAELAQRYGVAIVAVRHLNKASGGNPLYRGGGSIAFIGAARSGLLVAADPDDPDERRRVLASTKCNLAELPPALAYHLGTNLQGVTRVVWEGPSSNTARTLLVPPNNADDPPGALGEAKAFLEEQLANGPKAALLIEAAARGAHIAERTLRRAKGLLGVVSTKSGQPGAVSQGWNWELPSTPTDQSPRTWPTRPKASTSIGMAAFDELGNLRADGSPADSDDDADEVLEWCA